MFEHSNKDLFLQKYTHMPMYIRNIFVLFKYEGAISHVSENP